MANGNRSTSTSDIVARLTELVEVASTAISQQTGEENRNQRGEQRRDEEPARNEDVLRRLYPSMGLTGHTAVTRSVMPSSFRNINPCNPSTGISSRLFSLEKGRKRKHAEEKETYKDVFFLNDPKMSTVPRRQDREFFYDCGLVASAVLFSSSMEEWEIRKAIEEAIPRFKNMDAKPSFEFLKAVGPRLVSVQDITSWNYRILKHQTGQGPLYVRAYNFMDVGTNRIEDCLKAPSSATYVEDCNVDVQYCHSYIAEEDFDAQPLSAVIGNGCANQETTKDVVEVKSTKGPYDLSPSLAAGAATSSLLTCSTTTNRQCPIFSCYFPAHIIQSHSNECLDCKTNPETELYNDLMFEEDLFLDIASNVSSEEEAMQQDCIVEEKVTPHETRRRIKDILGKLECNVVPDSKRLHVRRKTIWSDYLDYRKKKWVKKDSFLTLVFVGEPAVDDGGPRREFFAGI